MQLNSKKWSNVTYLERIVRQAKRQNVLTGEWMNLAQNEPIKLRFRCDCGHEWEMLEEEFGGRRKLKNCGRPECPYVVQERDKMKGKERRVERQYVGRPPLPLQSRTMPVTVAMSLALRGEMEEKAMEMRISFSEAVRAACTLWLAE